MGEEAVVVAAASTETATVSREGYARDHGEVDEGVIGEEETCWFEDMKGAFAKLSCQLTEFQVVAYYDGEENALALGEGSGDELVSVHLIGERMIEEDGLGRNPAGVLLKGSGDAR